MLDRSPLPGGGAPREAAPPRPTAAPSAAPGAGEQNGLRQLVRKRVQDQLSTSGPYETQLDRAAQVALRMFGVKTVRLSLFDTNLEWERDTEQSTSPASAARDVFDMAADSVPELLLVTDASKDARFATSPLVVDEPRIRFYACAPIAEPSGRRVGSLRLMDVQPRVLTEPELFILHELVDQIEKEVGYRQELERAAIVQRSLAPRAFTAVDGYDVAGLCSPARMVGGDFYDWYPTPRGAAFTLADVMGKGVGAAIVAATVRAVMRSGARNDDIGAALDASTAALDIDADGAPGFVTLFHARLDAENGRISYVDAGHGLAIIVSGASRTARRLTSTDLPLGIGSEGEWQEHVEALEPGDSLVVVSDGVLDFFEGSLLALEEVEGVVLESRTAQEAVDEIVRRSSDGATDDITAMVIRRL
ncbi:MAG: SpoIIE family protein phosphatase [Naasia sp.]